MKYVLATLQSVLTVLFAYRLFYSTTTFSVLLGLFGTALFATLAIRNIMKIRQDDEKALFGVPRETPATTPIHPAPAAPINAGPYANDLIYTATANTVPTGHNSTMNASVPQAPWTQDGSNTAGMMIGGMALGAAGYAVAQAWNHDTTPEPTPAPSTTTETSSAPVSSTSTETTTTPDTSSSYSDTSSGGSFE